MEWVWDERKAAANYRKHGIRFETAVQVFEDAFLLTVPDPHPDDDRWRTVGVVSQSTLLVVHAEIDDKGTGRIISTRRATQTERRRYEKISC
jgi:uncharacterized protein